MSARTCLDCPAPISRLSRGRCRRCALAVLNADPAWQAKRAAGTRAVQQSEAFRTAHRAACKAGAARRMADPVKRAQLIELGNTVGKANLVRLQSGEVRARAGRKARAAHLAWCPERHWPLNRKLKSNGYRLPDRQRIIAELVRSEAEAAAAAEQARMESMTLLERQLAAVRAGARVVAKIAMPSRTHVMTLGGVAPEAL